MIEVKNVMEEIVYDAIMDVLKDINDILAKALNDLPPKYYVTDQSKILQKLESLRMQTEVDVISACDKSSCFSEKKS